MISPEILEEAQKYSIERRHEVQALTSKIRGLNGQLNSVLQKQERLRLEALRLRRQLKTLSARSKTIVKNRINESAVVPDELSGLDDVHALLRGGVFESDLQEFETVCAEAESLLAEVSEPTPATSGPTDSEGDPPN